MSDTEKHNAEKQRIKELIDQRFPMPAPRNLPGSSAHDSAAHDSDFVAKSREAFSQFDPVTGSWVPHSISGELYDQIVGWHFEYFAHMAVNKNRKAYRDLMLNDVRESLLHNEPLPVAARAWLLYVFSHYECPPLLLKAAELLFNGEPLPAGISSWLYRSLGNLKDIPHESKGRAYVDQSEFKDALLSFILESGWPIPRGQVVARLKAASQKLGERFHAASYEKIRRAYYSKSFQKRLSNQSADRLLWSAEEFLEWSD